MDCRVCFPQDPWLHIFRKNLHLKCSTLEYARKAILYNPCNDTSCSYDKYKIEDGQTLNTHQECDGFALHDVAYVFKLGDEAFINVSDYRINLYKIYLVLTEAIRRIKTLERSDTEYDACRERLSQLLFLLKRFSHYATISTKLSSGSLSNLHSNVNTVSMCKSQRPERHKDITSKFEIDQNELDIVIGASTMDVDDNSVENKNCTLPIISWSFFRRAKCEDIFALLCYTLATGSFDAFEVILNNSSPCIRKHVKDHWKVLLSYIPISSDCKSCFPVFGSTFSLHKEPTDEDITNATDWFIWKTFLILNYTKSSFLLIRFVKNTFKIFEKVPQNRLQLVVFLKFMIRQYLIYKSSATSNELAEGEDISFFDYIDMDAADKLQLFCELSNKTILSNDCECGDFVKDKHKVYKFCLLCRTKSLSSKLKAFFTLIEPSDVEYRLSNQFLPLDKNFGTYYSSLIKSLNSSLEDYILKLSGNFRGELDTNGFEMLYSLTDALLQTEFRPRVYSLLIGIIYSKNADFNILEHYFIIRSIFSLVGSSARGTMFKDNFSIADTHLNVLFSKKFNMKCNVTPHHSYGKLCSVIESGSVDDIIPLAVDCQLDFVESLLNLLLLVEVDLVPSHLSITPMELTNALCDTDSILHLLQKVLVYIMNMSLPLQDFRNCIHELSNMSLHISSHDINTVYSLLFYTMCLSCDNVSYLEVHLNIWLDFCKTSLEQLANFANSSLKCVYDTIYKLDAMSSSYCHLFQFVANFCNYTPKIYPCNDSVEKTLKISQIITVYLRIIGADSNCSILLDYRNVFSLIDKISDITVLTKDRTFMCMLEKLCMIQKIYEAFDVTNSVMNLHYVRQADLSYKSYESRDFIIHSISSLANVIYETRFNYEEKERLTIVVLSSILSSVERDLKLRSDALQTDILENIASILCPRDIKRHIITLVNAIGNLSCSNSPAVGELCASPVSSLAVTFFTLIVLKSENLSYIATFLHKFQKNQLRKPLSFILGNINACYYLPDHGYELQEGCNIISLLKNELKHNIQEDLTGSALTLEQEIFKALNTVNISKVDVKNSEKVKVSLEKFANRISGNVASGFISAALEKADGLYSMTKVPKFESIKERFWRSAKKETKSCFLPILNYFDSTPLIYENSGSENLKVPDILSWMSLEDFDLLQLIKLDADLASFTLMELCAFELNPKFVTLVLYSLNTLDTFHNLRFLQSLILHVKHLGWPIVEPLGSICNFLTVLNTIPSEPRIVLGSFIRDSTYRKGVFSERFVSNNLDVVKYIYGVLHSLYTCSSLESQINDDFTTCLSEDYISNIFFDGKIDIPKEFKSAEIFDEYVNVLLASYETLFIEQDESVYHSFHRLEPMFLFHSDAFSNCLLRIYEHSQNMDSRFWLLWRYSVYKLLLIDPNIDVFDMLYIPRSLSVIQMLESIAKTLPNFKISVIDDNIKEFKRALMDEVNIENYFYISNAMENVDRSFSEAVYRNIELKLRPHSNDTFDSTRNLFEFDLSLATL
ncbi:conserved hypothetical protein [Theileria equi strain WA]|uniref:Uncharacterized protein n=1 Tax=Theileria equi strain WA TaxID=1537102 RepID=L1LB54_THEEQ|nr:conserved hypothetical protein [Theileria equi strain WA]EKX72672.1 conserved hypothetical protein [Theileria equi strain WA]|eukprot:XP_004832124.1 conserved hypothetical protein [Theileria equi strain WA]